MKNSFKRERWNHRDYEPNPAELKQMMEEAYRPGLLLNKTSEPEGPGLPGSWLGGEPTLPPEIDWPWFLTEGMRTAPMHFMAQINLAEVPDLDEYSGSLRTGTLFFFYTPILKGYIGRGTDVTTQVIYVDHDVSDYPARKMPLFPPWSSFPPYADWEAEYKETPTTGLRRWNIEFLSFDMYDQHMFQNEFFRSEASDANEDIFEHLDQKTDRRRSVAGSDFCRHRLFGAGRQNGPFGDFTRVLTIESDTDIGFVEGDFDAAVFWIPTIEFKAAIFQNAVVALE